MRKEELLRWIASIPPEDRDTKIHAYFGFGATPDSMSPGEHLIGYHESGVAALVSLLVEVPVTSDDVFIDLGAGLGKQVMLTNLLTGARAMGVELQDDLVRRAREVSERIGCSVQFAQGDARTSELHEGTVFFLYAPFTGPVLEAVLLKLRTVAEAQSIVVCSLGMDLEQLAPWLKRRAFDSFWLAIYDSAIPNARPRILRHSLLCERDAIAIASRILPQPNSVR